MVSSCWRLIVIVTMCLGPVVLSIKSCVDACENRDSSALLQSKTQVVHQSPQKDDVEIDTLAGGRKKTAKKKMSKIDTFAGGRKKKMSSQKDPVRTVGAQTGQDEWVLQKLGNAEGVKYYVDVGAHHGKLLSNTWHLDELGWRGLCIDPFLQGFDSRTCNLAHVAVAKEEGTADFLHCTGWRSAISGFPEVPGAQSMAGDRTQKFCKNVNVTTKPLSQMFTEMHVPSIIDYMSVDVEGAELDVLHTFPFDTHCARLVTVEHTSFRGTDNNKGAIKSLLEARGCTVSSKEQDFFVECQC